ncbi:TPA_asm: PTS lactose/cellobiose transporter subunit IIA [Listeria monocytogenes]|nr:PTS lactose/cellobiose transporter subunit IIA [Listeria monocytogenes]
MTDSNELTTELDSMAIILHAGNAKSCAFEALKEVKLQNISSFTQKITEAKDEIKLAHRAHAEGHLSSTDIAVEMIRELGEIYQWKWSLSNE